MKHSRWIPVLNEKDIQLLQDKILDNLASRAKQILLDQIHKIEVDHFGINPNEWHVIIDSEKGENLNKRRIAFILEGQILEGEFLSPVDTRGSFMELGKGEFGVRSLEEEGYDILGEHHDFDKRRRDLPPMGYGEGYPYIINNKPFEGFEGTRFWSHTVETMGSVLKKMVSFEDVKPVLNKMQADIVNNIKNLSENLPFRITIRHN
jgi:hypothetical protein